MPVDVAEVFTTHFTTIGQKVAKAFQIGKKVKRERTRKRTNKSFHLHYIKRYFVKFQLLSLKEIDFDKIGSRVLKDSADIIAPSLQALVKTSFCEEKFTNKWKSAKVVALLKSGDRSNFVNYITI